MKSIILLSAVLLTYSAPAQTLKQRVVAESEYNLVPGLIIVDSVQYKYSFNRGSTYRYGSKTYDYYYQTGFNPMGDDNSYFSPDVAADTVWIYSLSTSGMIPKIASVYHGLKILDYYDLNTFKNGFPVHKRYQAAYDSQGKIVQRTTLELNQATSTWDFAGKTVFWYDFLGRHTVDSSFRPYATPNPNMQFVSMVPRSYDAAGNEAETSYQVPPGVQNNSNWNTMEKWVFTYYPDHKLQTILVEELSSSMLNTTAPVRRDSFAYDTGVDFYTRKWSWDYSNSSSPTYLAAYVERSLNAQNLPDTVRNFVWASQLGALNWKRTEDVVFTYNGALNPKSWTSYIYVNGQPIADRVHHFYYELFDTTITSIAHGLRNEEIVAYPNPVSDVLNIRWNNNNHKPVTIELFNAVGNRVSTFARTGYQSTLHISISHLAPGLYLLSIRDQSGAAIFRRSIIKQ